MLWYVERPKFLNTPILTVAGLLWTVVGHRNTLFAFNNYRLYKLGLRLADKRSLPCPNRYKWLAARDELYEEIMHKAWNKEGKFFGQSYEETDVVDAAVLIMPLVFFMQAVRLIRLFP